MLAVSPSKGDFTPQKQEQPLGEQALSVMDGEKVVGRAQTHPSTSQHYTFAPTRNTRHKLSCWRHWDRLGLLHLLAIRIPGRRSRRLKHRPSLDSGLLDSTLLDLTPAHSVSLGPA